MNNSLMLRLSIVLASFVVFGCTVGGATFQYKESLDAVLSKQSEADSARNQYRHPMETLAFFGVEPGMTVVESLPGSGWYTRILAEYLGAEGTLYGVDYPSKIWDFFPWAKPEWVEKRKAAAVNFPETVAGYSDSGVMAVGFTFDTVPGGLEGSVDRVLMIRALHNLNRFEAKANTRTDALKEVHRLLKPNGHVGVVQHRAPESASAEWADGSNGYLKQSAVIAFFKEAGFELVATSDINANPKDQPTEKDGVWRLPPSLRGAAEGTPERAEREAIGESDRMTLLFKKAG